MASIDVIRAPAVALCSGRSDSTQKLDSTGDLCEDECRHHQLRMAVGRESKRDREEWAGGSVPVPEEAGRSSQRAPKRRTRRSRRGGGSRRGSAEKGGRRAEQRPGGGGHRGGGAEEMRRLFCCRGSTVILDRNQSGLGRLLQA
jgi:hypothetical protein